ncbi:LysE family translocator [Ulvibacter antarcticus]|uniref:Threonine/homoserine/homoserine lactone efflux protein n=1 Tax=Ulvibacter antarcticus TaxID=442714 RepID=A0A3L9Z7F1_9FLAO|nr:lysine transporter LysE [Ulvibacter antarcticus]RMA66358.1 threonine/homoserine/homoserine lactone efflux protein [Ulvibacter antarcticus]
MALILNFLVGFLAALIGVIPPGLLNMSAAKISMKEGRKAAVLFSIGVCVTVFIQTYIALLFAKYLDHHPEIVDILQKVALGIFICITIYFFFIAKDTRREIPENGKHSKTNRFFYGMLLGALNLLPFPYWVYISITFAGFGWFQFTQPELWAAVIASGLGTFVMLMLYIQFFKRKEATTKMKVNMNYIIGIITATISVITFLKVLKEI